MPRTPKGQNWIVRVQATITKDVYCEDCTEEEARANPFEHSVGEEDMDMIDYTVKDVMHND